MYEKVDLIIDGAKEKEVLVSLTPTVIQLDDLVHRGDFIFIFGDPETRELYCLLSEPYDIWLRVREILATNLPDGNRRARITLVPAEGEEGDNIVFTLTQDQYHLLQDGTAVLIFEGKKLNTEHIEVHAEVLLRSYQDAMDYVDVNFANEFPPGEPPEDEEEEE